MQPELEGSTFYNDSKHLIGGVGVVVRLHNIVGLSSGVRAIRTAMIGQPALNRRHHSAPSRRVFVAARIPWHDLVPLSVRRLYMPVRAGIL